jgi:hypothetical protein
MLRFNFTFNFQHLNCCRFVKRFEQYLHCLFRTNKTFLCRMVYAWFVHLHGLAYCPVCEVLHCHSTCISLWLLEPVTISGVRLSSLFYYYKVHTYYYDLWHTYQLYWDMIQRACGYSLPVMTAVFNKVELRLYYSQAVICAWMFIVQAQQYHCVSEYLRWSINIDGCLL